MMATPKTFRKPAAKTITQSAGRTSAEAPALLYEFGHLAPADRDQRLKPVGKRLETVF
jgi:hypothetical protein